MHISKIAIEVPTAESLVVTEDTLSVDLSDGRTISVPLGWYPRLVHASPSERNNWRFIGNKDTKNVTRLASVFVESPV